MSTKLVYIKIVDRVNWQSHCNWIENTCDEWYDYTNWDLWGLGLADIEYYIPEKYVCIYYLSQHS